MHERTSFRPEIQGLRAVAVVSVVLFHIWPDMVPGGYVGVDVFFVISGYLITGLLYRELQATGGISLLGFYERRVRRLLPAATLVLIAIILALPLLPETRWRETAIEIAASAVYLENWRLAHLAVDYLGSENAASPVQHYWSLSIEEQFYIFWPLTMIAAAMLLSRLVTVRAAVLIPLCLLTIGSFAASVWLTQSNAAEAYFVTHTRAWELGIGALLAIIPLPALSPRIRELMRLTGLSAIAFCSFAYSTTTAFPGYAALLPTLGCALVIAAASDAGSWSYRALAARPAQYLGDISYSVYLWHWPLVVFVTLASPEAYAWLAGPAILVASLVAADLTKRYVEDAFRRKGQYDPLRAVFYGAVSVATCIAASAAVYVITLQTPPVVAAERNYPGSAALLAGIDVPKVKAPIPPLTALKDDLPTAYDEECHVPAKSAKLNPCRRGKPDGTFHLVLIGDSHAASWIPALDEAAKLRGWRVTTHTKSGCAVLKEMLTIRGNKPYETCYKWGQDVLKALKADPPDLILATQSIGQTIYDPDQEEKSAERMVAGILDLWTDLHGAGIDIVAIRDTPRLPFEPGECLAKQRDCAAPRDRVFRGPDPIVLASKKEGVPLIDMTDALCSDLNCPAVVGNVVVWRDRHHLSATYSRTIAGALAARIEDAITRLSAETASY